MEPRTEFLDALAGDDLPKDERLILCGFPGDPNKAPPGAWRPRPWRPGREPNLEPPWNAYTTVSSFRVTTDGTFRRRAETFAAGRALMIDDVGTKVERKIVAGLRPSAIVETSAGNEQWWYFLDKPERDMRRFDAVIRGFIYSRLLGNDPGMNGVTRVGRIPGYVNGKPKNHGWRCNLLELSAERFSVDELIDHFNIKLLGLRMSRVIPPDNRVENVRAFIETRRQLMPMLKREHPDPSGWMEMTCPWLEEHTDRADTGAAIRMPAEENGWYGAFRCHHGHCADRGWGDLTDWLMERNVELLEEAAQNG